MQNVVPCKVCGAKAPYIFALPQGTNAALELHLCSECGLLFVSNIPSDERLAAMYSRPDAPDYYESVATENQMHNVGAAKDVEALLREGRFRNPAVCDVGCGIGQFLEILRKRNPELHLVGTELSSSRAAVARNRGFEVSEHGLSEQGEKFAVITMLDVAEHVSNPVGIFAECHGSLLPGGSLYIHTPCRCFWDSVALFLVRFPRLRKLGLKWLTTRVSMAHLQLWTHKSLQSAYEQAGFHMSGFRRELELSWPVDKYISIYLGRNSKIPGFLLRIVTLIAEFFLVRLRVLRNKVVAVAQRA